MENERDNRFAAEHVARKVANLLTCPVASDPVLLRIFHVFFYPRRGGNRLTRFSLVKWGIGVTCLLTRYTQMWPSY